MTDSVSSEPVQAEIINKIYKYTVNKSLYLSVNVFNTGHFPDPIGIKKSWFLKKGENQSTGRKTSWSKDEKQQQTQPTYDDESGN